MSEEFVNRTIELVQTQVQDLERQLQEKKRVANDLCALNGRAPIYADTGSSSVATSIRSDEFYGKPLATVVRTVLEKRAAANLGAATVNEIYDAMVQGGYPFDAKNDENAKRGLYISLGKNSTTFHKLPNGTYGLLDWYPAMKGKREADDATGRISAFVRRKIMEDTEAANGSEDAVDEEAAAPKRPR